MYHNLLEVVTLHNRDWFKIKGDDAFPYVLNDWYDGYGEAYMRYVKTPNVVVQAGGFCGIYPSLFAEKFAMVYTFEPDPINFFCLTMNCQSDNIIKIQAALGDEHQLVNVTRHCDTNKGMNTVGHSATSPIPTFRIDDLALSYCDLIQLDTEGYELKILNGALETIQKFGPVISVEDAKPELRNLLDSFGYKPMLSANRDTIFVR